ncbi:MAG: hypothetical protein E7A62_01040 [Actinomycetaceae bacterium]|nr:hypothetical protein [Actinomycetaceae bacterium]MDU0969563.1 hypothetical protein [Actinomycetaceae bacterium]
MGSHSKRPRQPLSENERAQWIYEDMMNSVRRGEAFVPEDAPEEIPDFSAAVYVKPQVMKPKTDDDYRSFARRGRGFLDGETSEPEAGWIDSEGNAEPDEVIGRPLGNRGTRYTTPIAPREDTPTETPATPAEAEPRQARPQADSDVSHESSHPHEKAPTHKASKADGHRRMSVHRPTRQPRPTGTTQRALPSRKGVSRVKQAPMHKRLVRMWPLLIALVITAALVLAGIAGFGYYRESHPKGVSTQMTITGDIGTVPVLDLPAPLPLTFPKTQVVTRGKGASLEENDPVLLRLTVFDGKTGKLLSSGDAPHYLAGRVNAETLTPDIEAAVLGQKVGSRLALRRPVSRSGEQAMEIDVIDVLPTEATGKPTKPDDNPPVTIDESDDSPTLGTLAEEPPKSAYLKVLRTGSGAQVQDGTSVIANFAVWRWHDKSQSSNTWEGKGPQVIDLAGAMTGLREQLSDQRVGSRVVIVLPPELAQGDDTLVVVVDILAVIDHSK